MDNPSRADVPEVDAFLMDRKKAAHVSEEISDLLKQAFNKHKTVCRGYSKLEEELKRLKQTSLNDEVQIKKLKRENVDLSEEVEESKTRISELSQQVGRLLTEVQHWSRKAREVKQSSSGSIDRHLTRTTVLTPISKPTETVLTPISKLTETVFTPKSKLTETVFTPISKLTETVLTPISKLTETPLDPCEGFKKTSSSTFGLRNRTNKDGNEIVKRHFVDEIFLDSSGDEQKKTEQKKTEQKKTEQKKTERKKTEEKKTPSFSRQLDFSCVKRDSLGLPIDRSRRKSGRSKGASSGWSNGGDSGEQLTPPIHNRPQQTNTCKVCQEYWRAQDAREEGQMDVRETPHCRIHGKSPRPPSTPENFWKQARLTTPSPS